MFINDFENSNDYKLHQILHTLKSVHGVELKFEESTPADLAQLRQSSEIIKNSIVSESQFNTYNTNPEYTKHTLIMEAIRLFLTEIAPKRQKKTKVKENAVPSIPPTPSQPANTSVNADKTAAPGTVKVMKGTDMKSVPAAQLAGLQSQGYKVMGDDETEPTVSENGPETAPDGHSPELEALMKKYGVEGDDVDEGMKEKIGGMLRRQGQKDHPLQNRRDVAHRKAGDAYAAGDTKNGKRYMDWRQKSADKDKIDLAHAPFEGAEAAPDGHSPELEALMKKYGVEGEVDEGMKEKISGMMRRMREKGGFGKSRADLVHRKANVAYALGDKNAGDRSMGVLNKGAVRSAQKAVAKPTSKAAPTPAKKGLQPTQQPTVTFGKRKPALAESAGSNPHEYQASMARAELYRNTKYAMEMMRIVRPNDDVQPWIAANLVQAAEYLDQVFHYMDYYTKFEPQSLPEEEDMTLDPAAPVGPGTSTGATARENLLMIVEYSTKLFNIIHPGDKLEGWVAMKLTSASNAVSNSKHYLDYVQFEKHASDHIADMAPAAEPIDEEAPVINKKKIKENVSVGTMLMRMMVNEDQDLAQAQALLAAKSLSDDLMTMAEKVSKMSVEDLLPLVDTMKDQFGPEAAEGYSDMMKQTLEALLNATTEAKNTSDNAITQLQGGTIPGAATDMGGEEGGLPAPGGDEGGDMGAPEGGMPSMPEVPEEPLGRAKKGDELAEAWGTKMKTPASKKGMWDGYTLAELKAKKKKLMDKEERSAAEQTKVKELNFAIRAKQKNKWGNVKESEQDVFGKRPVIRSKFVGSDLKGIKAFLSDKCSFGDLDQTLQKKLKSRYGARDDEGMYDALASAIDKGDFGSNFRSIMHESMAIMERNKANAAKKKAVIDPKKRDEKKDKFDFRNLKDKSVQDSKKKVDEAKKPAKDEKKDDKKDEKKDDGKKKFNFEKKKVDESAPPGKKAEDFIKDNKAEFKDRYGKKWQEVLYATAWKKFGDKKESFEKAGKMLESHKVMLAKLERAFAAHKAGYKQMVKEGKADDPLNMGYGLEGELILEQIGGIKDVIAKIKEMIRAEIQQGAIAMVVAEQQADKLSTVAAAKKVAPWGVAWKSKAGTTQAKFFESQSDRDYWVGLKNLNEAKLINPGHFDKEIAKLSNKKG